MSDVAKENLVMEHLVTLTYREKLTPNLNRYADHLLEGRIIGAKCPVRDGLRPVQGLLLPVRAAHYRSRRGGAP